MDNTLLAGLNFIDREYSKPDYGWRTSSVLSSFNKNFNRLYSQQLSCFWGLPKFLYTHSDGFYAIAQSLYNPKRGLKYLLGCGYANPQTIDNIDYKAIVEDCQKLFGHLFNIYLIETDGNKHIIYENNNDFNTTILLLLFSNIFSIFRYIDGEYLSGAFLKIIKENDRIETFRDVFILGEKLKKGQLGHNANDTITLLFLNFGSVLIDSHLSKFSSLTPELLNDKKYYKVLTRILKEKGFNFTENAWIGQTEHYNTLIEAAKEV